MWDTLREWQADWPPLAFDTLRYFNGLVLVAAIFVPLERAFGLRRQPVLRTGWRRDVVYYFLTSLLPGRLLVFPIGALAWALHDLAPSGLWPELATLPVALRFGLAFLVAEVGFYWGHRWMHEWPWLWRFHAVHHSAQEMDWLVNTRAHPVDLVFVRLCGLLPLYVLGLVQPASGAVDWLPLLVVLVGSTWGYLIHANLRWRFGVLEWIVSTPAFHHRHHACLEGAAREHGNYAAFLPALDLVFRTWRSPALAWPVRYGTAEPVPAALIDQLMEPFMPAAGDRVR